MKIQKILVGTVVLSFVSTVFSFAAPPVEGPFMGGGKKGGKISAHLQKPRIAPEVRKNLLDTVKKSVWQELVRQRMSNGLNIMNDADLSIRPGGVLEVLSADAATSKPFRAAKPASIPFATGAARQVFPEMGLEIVDDENLSLRPITAQPVSSSVSSEVRESFPALNLEIVNDADFTIRPITLAPSSPNAIANMEKSLTRVGQSKQNLPALLPAPVRQYMPGLGYILDDADSSFIPESGK